MGEKGRQRKYRKEVEIKWELQEKIEIEKEK